MSSNTVLVLDSSARLLALVGFQDQELVVLQQIELSASPVKMQYLKASQRLVILSRGPDLQTNFFVYQFTDDGIFEFDQSVPLNFASSEEELKTFDIHEDQRQTYLATRKYQTPSSASVALYKYLIDWEADEISVQEVGQAPGLLGADTSSLHTVDQHVYSASLNNGTSGITNMAYFTQTTFFSDDDVTRNYNWRVYSPEDSPPGSLEIALGVEITPEKDFLMLRWISSRLVPNLQIVARDHESGAKDPANGLTNFTDFLHAPQEAMFYYLSDERGVLIPDFGETGVMSETLLRRYQILDSGQAQAAPEFLELDQAEHRVMEFDNRHDRLFHIHDQDVTEPGATLEVWSLDLDDLNGSTKQDTLWLPELEMPISLIAGPRF